jgi:hypothetical protein
MNDTVKDILNASSKYWRCFTHYYTRFILIKTVKDYLKNLDEILPITPLTEFEVWLLMKDFNLLEFNSLNSNEPMRCYEFDTLIVSVIKVEDAILIQLDSLPTLYELPRNIEEFVEVLEGNGIIYEA